MSNFKHLSIKALVAFDVDKVFDGGFVVFVCY
jgi:hypothetical protein